MPGIFSAIDSYGKQLIHAHLDQHRRLPDWLAGLAELAKPGDVTTYVPRLHHSWFRYEDQETEITLTGVPDDVLLLSNGSYLVADYKTARLTETQHDLLPMFAAQINCYAYIAERLVGRTPLAPVAALALVYLEPQTTLPAGALLEASSASGLALRFTAAIRPVANQAEEVVPRLLGRAREIADHTRPPPHREQCPDLPLLAQLVALAGGGSLAPRS